jgi:hypothetical protein
MARFQDRGDSGLAVSGIFFARNGAVMEEVPFLGAVSGNLAAVCGRIEVAARAAGRPPEGVSLIAVSKTQPAEAVREALRAGQRLFGENFRDCAVNSRTSCRT